MRILIFGAGVLGCNLASNLFRAGRDVTLLARGAWAEEIQRNGLRIKNSISRRTVVSRIPVAAELSLLQAHVRNCFRENLRIRPCHERQGGDERIES